jgi:hypothetical protein
MDERSIDICDRSATDRAGVVRKDPLFLAGRCLIACVTTVRVLGATDTRWCDVPGSLRHMATSNCDWLLEQIDSSRFKHRMEAAEQEVSLAHAMLVSVMRLWTPGGGEEESDEDGNVDGSDTE